jgi:hypothetical protein
MDLGKKVLIDVFDYDFGKTDDFIGFTEPTLRQLLDAAVSATPLQLSPPPPPHKQDAGWIFVDKALLALPQARIRMNSRREWIGC